MAILDIVTYPDPRLRERAREVESVTDEIRKLLDDMAETMYEAPGIGLAANQVGVLHRAIVVDVGEDPELGIESKLYKILNPSIVKQLGSSENEEGCLSIPDVREYVTRSEQVTVIGLDENGKEITLEADGLLAICLQHEIDHLNGVLFIDHLSRLKRSLLKNKLDKLAKKR